MLCPIGPFRREHLPTYTQDSANAGLISYYGFTNALDLGEDLMGVNPLTNFGVTQVASGFGNLGAAGFFERVNGDRLVGTDTPTLEFKQKSFFINGWCRQTAGGSIQAILSKWFASSNQEWRLQISAGGALQWSTSVNGTANIQIATTAPAAGNWFMFTCGVTLRRPNSYRMHLRIDQGTRVFGGVTGNMFEGSARFFISGRDNGGTGVERFDGDITNVGIWGKNPSLWLEDFLWNNGNGRKLPPFI